MRLFGLIGHPLGHSFSKDYFKRKFERDRLECDYQNFDLTSIEELPSVIQNHPLLNGFNVTIPYKQTIIPYLDRLDATAEEIQAVNTVTVDKDGTMKGYNTDVTGFETLLDKSGFLRLDGDKKALILGTGGASQAVQFVLKKQNIDYQTVSRSHLKGNLTYEELTDEVVGRHLLIVNATPLGTFPKVDTYPAIPYDAIGIRHTLIDLVYNPEETAFLRQGKQYGASTFNGMTMLTAQAEAAWRIWNTNNTL